MCHSMICQNPINKLVAHFEAMHWSHTAFSIEVHWANTYFWLCCWKITKISEMSLQIHPFLCYWEANGCFQLNEQQSTYAFWLEHEWTGENIKEQDETDKQARHTGSPHINQMKINFNRQRRSIISRQCSHQKAESYRIWTQEHDLPN